MKLISVAMLLVLLAFGGAVVQETAAQEDEAPLIFRSSAPDPSQFILTQLASGFDRPLYMTHAGDGSGRLFVLEQSGKIWILQQGARLDTPFLDISGLLTRDVFGGGYTERGLLGLAFHPQYAQNGQFFINYTDRSGSSVVARYVVSDSDAALANPDSAEVLLTIQQPYANHNGGQMAFGPDGYLYVSVGDGGSAGDPQNNAQNPYNLLGKILRLDVDSAVPYAIPPDNPFAAGGGAPEIWAWGLRNVWRFSFDRATSDLYLADVGQNQWEEVNFQPAGSPGGQNYGWRVYEGMHRYSGETGTDAMVLPVLEYPHGALGCSISGGYVYRGTALPDLQAVYLYSDFCSGIVWGAWRDESAAWQNMILTETGRSISSFGEDEVGELYLLDYSGTIFAFSPLN